MKRQLIKTKSIDRIFKIILADFKRSYNFEAARLTKLWNEDSENRNIYLDVQLLNNEKGFLIVGKDDNNWSFLTSHHLFGKNKGLMMKVKLDEIEDYSFGLIKDLDSQMKELKVNTNCEQLLFLYEPNTGGLMLKTAFEFLKNHWENNAIEK